ncbi:MAG: glycosyl hydrolase family 28 protein [Pyrinomonadaceae bacterium]|nr:glycosyl hydrolase family 28 protein [Pyrinomonadaceae bacterium]
MGTAARRWKLPCFLFLASCYFVGPALGQATFPLRSDALPAWVDQVGARRSPGGRRTFPANAYGAVPDGVTNSTQPIQKAIDACAKAGGGLISFKPGTYLTGAIFLKSNVHLRIDQGVTLLGSQEDSDYPSIATRISGIEMNWPAALINVNGQRNVKISGGGTIDGHGEKWWAKYWKLRREDYEPRGLRWASDYDAERVRLMVIWKAADVTVENLSLKRSGFWTVQVVYSDHVTVDAARSATTKARAPTELISTLPITCWCRTATSTTTTMIFASKPDAIPTGSA